ncbi:MAG: hypothetical protein WA138_11310 [Parvibaculum sp.]
MDEITTVAERNDTNERRFTWEARLLQASPIGVTLTSVLISLLVFTTYLLCVWWNSLPIIVMNMGDPTLTSDAWTAICMSLLWGSILGLGEYTRVANLADLQLLKARNVMNDSAHFDVMMFGPLKETRRRGQAFGLLGACVGYIFYRLIYQPEGHPVDLLDATLTNYWFIVMTLMLFIEIFRNLSYLRADTMSLLANLDHRIKINLFNIDNLDGLGRIALRRALPWVAASAIVFLMSFAQSTSILFWPLFVGLMISAALIFGLPMWRVHGLIDRAKNVELAKLRLDIARASHAFRQDENVEAASRLAALIALERRLERVREWPLDVSTVVRFGLYLALPLGSWLGGALVEKALDVLTR